MMTRTKETDWRENQPEAVDFMIEHHLLSRGIRDPGVLNAMRTIPRHLFIPHETRRDAYADMALAIAEGQTISQPYIVAFILEQLALKSTDVVLEIGTGSGYQAAVAAEIAALVYSVEIREGLARSAQQTFEVIGYKNIFVRSGDGYQGWADYSPYDAIMVTAGAEEIPQNLVDQLKPGGRMVLPLGPHDSVRQLVLIQKTAGILKRTNLLPVRFVPMKKP